MPGDYGPGKGAARHLPQAVGGVLMRPCTHRADIGLLFVHGIGRQRRAETLLESGEAIREEVGSKGV